MLLFDLRCEVEDFYFLSEVRMGNNVICVIGFEALNWWTLVGSVAFVFCRARHPKTLTKFDPGFPAKRIKI